VLLGERLIELSGLRRRSAVDPALGRWLEDVRRAERAATTGPTRRRGLYRDTAAP
jgi:hypothetical protein